MTPSLRVATVRDIPIEIHPSWFITFLLVTLTLAVGLFPVDRPGLPAAVYWVMGVAASLLFFLSVLIHELAHSLVALGHGIPIRRITLFIFGGLAQIGGEPDRPRVEFRVAIAGPLASLALAGLFRLLMQLFAGVGADTLVVFTGYLARINFVLAVFNMTPAFPLDGGRVLRAVLWAWTGNLERATAIAAAIGQGFAMFLIAWGILGVLAGQIIQGLWLTFIGWFLQQASQTGSAQAAIRRTLAGIPVSRLMSSPVQVVSADLPVRQLVEDYFYRYRYTAFPVVRNGTVVGVVSLHQVRDTGPERWDTARVGDIAAALDPGDLIDPHMDAADALMRMAERGTGRLLVMEEGRLVGLVSHTDILRLIQIQRELRV